MSPLLLCAGSLRLELDVATGAWAALRSAPGGRSWLAPAGVGVAGLPFVAGTALGSTLVPLEWRTDGSDLVGTSVSGLTVERIAGQDDALAITLDLPPDTGPRAGLRLDLDHLDLPGGEPAQQVMPVIIATAPDLSWAYLVWQRAEDDLLVLAVDGPSAGWAIDYSIFGHQMRGFSVLARADEVIAPLPGGRLPTVTRLVLRLAHAGSRDQALATAARLLGLAMLVPEQNGVAVGGRIGLRRLGTVTSLRQVLPDGSSTGLAPEADSVRLDTPGLHHFAATAPNGRVHATVLFALDRWQALAERSLGWYGRTLATPAGAFGRVARANGSLVGRTFENVAFADPEEPMSCRTGEFGGFIPWAMLRHQQRFGARADYAAWIEGYLAWILNRGREDRPRPGTVSRAPHVAHGIPRGPFHFFNEINYAQHECFLVGQLADLVAGGRTDLVADLGGLAGHILDEHVRASDGALVNRNSPRAHEDDYTSVDTPALHLLAAAQALSAHEPGLAGRLRTAVRRMAGLLIERGLATPTEGEPCTEDGSIACAAWTLAELWLSLPDPDPAWRAQAERLLALHRKLEMSGCDVRTRGSTLRFWETQYEGDDRGPSLNAGHGWTLWTMLAKFALAEASGDWSRLLEAWEHTCCVAHRIQADGSMPPCWTPDVIPAPPHPSRWKPVTIVPDARPTTVRMGLDWPACRSTSGVFLFVTAPRTWHRISGCDPRRGLAVNAVLANDELSPCAPVLERLILASAPDRPLRVRVPAGAALAIACPQVLTITGLVDQRQDGPWRLGRSDGAGILRIAAVQP